MGLHFKKGKVVITGEDECDVPIFWEIQDIYVMSNNVYLALASTVIQHYSSHYHAWIISSDPSAQKKVIHVTSIHSRQCLHPHSISSVPSRFKFVTLKFAI